MKVLAFFASALLFVAAAGAQETSLVVQHGNKTKALKGGKLQVAVDISGGELNCGTRFIRGKIAAVGPDSIRIIPEEEIGEYTRANGVADRYERHYPAGMAPLALPREQLVEIAYQSPNARFSQGLGGTLTFLGAVTALIAAPLVSINYENGTFNSDRYYRVAAVGLGGVGVGIPLLWLGRTRHYALREYAGGPERVWKIR